MPEGAKAHFNYVEIRANDLIATARAAVPRLPPIYFGLVMNAKVNAVAFRAEDRYFIAVHTGTIFLLRLLIGRMLSDQRVFPSIGDPSNEKADLPPLADYEPEADKMAYTNKLSYPRDRLRGAYAQFLEDQALMFLVGHEITHISHGHVDYLHATRGLAHTEELSSAALSDAELRLERQCLEQDADRYSIVSRLGSMYRMQEDPQYRGPSWAVSDRSPERLIRDWSVSVNVLFRMFGDIRFSSSDLNVSNHPPLANRRMYLQYMAAWTIEQKWLPGKRKEIFDALRDGLHDTERAFAIALGTAVNAESIVDATSKASRDHMMLLQEYWRSTLEDKLRPYAYEL